MRPRERLLLYVMLFCLFDLHGENVGHVFKLVLFLVFMGAGAAFCVGTKAELVAPQEKKSVE